MSPRLISSDDARKSVSYEDLILSETTVKVSHFTELICWS